jgi:RNA polymerase sigma-70 factor (ECF subfamily)
MSGPGRNPVTDEALVRRIRADREGGAGRAAASELFGRYTDRVYLWCFRYCHDHERALDAAQDVLLAAWRALGGFEERARFSSWLYAIARHRCLRLLKRGSLTVDDETDPDSVSGTERAPEVLYEGREEEEGVLRLLDEALDPVEREAIWLRCFENLPVEEITEVLDLKGASGARGVLQAARRKLRAALERRRRREERDQR